ELVLFFDGSKSDDATGLVGCRLSDGLVKTFGVWQKPPNWPDETPWRVPREQVDGVVDRVFAEYRPVAFFADPGSGFDESDGERY
ncbi:terminase, partial [Streptomyces sp. A73]|nr:terminase [Streptomyces sp. A73]